MSEEFAPILLAGSSSLISTSWRRFDERRYRICSFLRFCAECCYYEFGLMLMLVSKSRRGRCCGELSWVYLPLRHDLTGIVPVLFCISKECGLLSRGPPWSFRAEFRMRCETYEFASRSLCYIVLALPVVGCKISNGVCYSISR